MWVSVGRNKWIRVNFMQMNNDVNIMYIFDNVFMCQKDDVCCENYR